MLWAAPWREDPAVQSDGSVPRVDRRLGGTFTCAPFGRDDVDGGPPHGLSANAPWMVTRASPAALTATRALGRGRVTARIALRDDHPVLYQTHLLDLDRPCTFAHHPIVQAGKGGEIRSNATRRMTFQAEAPTLPPGETSDMAPWTIPTDKHEDFATLVSPPGLAWTSLLRAAEDDTIVTLRRAEQLPVTNIWMSNGARSGIWQATRGLVGIEDGICAGALGFAAALGPNRVRDAGVPTALPAGRHVIAHALLRLPGAHCITAIMPGDGILNIETTDATLTLPFDETHLT